MLATGFSGLVPFLLYVPLLFEATENFKFWGGTLSIVTFFFGRNQSVRALVVASIIFTGMLNLAAPSATATGGTVTNFTGAGINNPGGITTGPDGALWFTNFSGNSIGRITTGGTVTNFTGAGIAGPQGITVGPDGALWFTNLLGNSIGRITTGGTVTNFTGAGIATPTGITVGPDGALWFTNNGYNSNSIGRITTSVTSTALKPSSPTRLQVTPANGSVTVRWSPPKSDGGSPITGYVIGVRPFYTDRLPDPGATWVLRTVPASQTSVNVVGLVADCHQRYKVRVVAKNKYRSGLVVTSRSFRPSGIISQGKPPKYVVILIDGINEAKPWFRMNPLQPTLDGEPSYCPESWNSATKPPSEAEADFAGSPNGPWEFFNKWNFASSAEQSYSTPRDVQTGKDTHAFMLDAIAATGAVILPYSYKGASLTQPPGQSPLFKFQSYTACDATPSFGSYGCNYNRSIGQDVAMLDNEIKSIRSVWRDARIIIFGHSQGGLIAFKWWQSHGADANASKGVTHLFSLDSPVNGVCVFVSQCAGPVGYPVYDERDKVGARYLPIDASQGYPFRFLGTWGEKVFGYGGGNDTLQRQLLVTGPKCGDGTSNADCKSPPDHISGCPILDKSPPWIQGDHSYHFVVKFCPDDVTYVNKTLGLIY